MDYEGFLELVQKRRSIRSLKADPIPDEQVDKVIEAARFAPSGFNLQPWEFVIVKDAELKKLFVDLYNARQDFAKVTFTHIRREHNSDADRMVNEALDRKHAPELQL